MPITKPRIIEAIHQGSLVANQRYEAWSRGFWITDSGVEGLLVASIAEALHERQDDAESLLMEAKFEHIEAWAETPPIPGVRPESMGRSNRADIVLFDRHGWPSCVIEVKRTWVTDRCLGDLARLRDLVRRLGRWYNGPIKRGFLAMIVAVPAPPDLARSRLLAKTREICAILHQRFPHGGLRWIPHLGPAMSLGKDYQQDFADWSAASLCIEVYPPNASS